MSRTDRNDHLAALHAALGRFVFETGLYSQAMADRHGLNRTDLDLIGLLHGREAVSAGQIAEALGLTTGAVTGLVDRLEKAGLVRRRSDPNDRRRVLVERVESSDSPADQFQSPRTQALLGRYTEAELSAVVRFVDEATTFLAGERTRLRGQPAPSAGGMTAPLGKLRAGHLLFPTGVARLALSGGAGPRELYQATFEGKPPAVEVDGGTVRIAYPRFRFGCATTGARIALNATVPWEVEIRGGVSEASVALRDVPLRALVVGGGASSVSVELPEPSGVVRVRIAGGASDVTLARPAGTAASLRFAGGASGLTFDRQRLGAIGGEARLESADFEGAEDRYEIEILGGASNVRVVAGPPDERT